MHSSRKRTITVLVVSLAVILLFFYGYRHLDSWSSSYYQLKIVQSLENENVYTLPPTSLSSSFPPPSPERKDYREWNAHTLRELHSCMALDNCGPNQRKVALLASAYFEERIVRGRGGGEGIWGKSMYNSLRALGYTTLLAINFDEALEQYRMMPDLVKVVLREMPAECQDNPRCVKSPENPTGIPAWKIFDFWYWPSHGGHPAGSRLGGKWILSSHPDDDYHGVSPIQYIGFSLEDECSKVPFIPLADRKPQVWMFMKLIRYVYDPWFSWEREWFARAAKELDMDFVGAWRMDQDVPDLGHFDNIEDRDARVINLGPELNHDDFIDQVRSSKVMLAMGNPTWSPSAWDAMCLGVPFIQPIRQWDHNDPWDRSKWDVQHPPLLRFYPPYMYHVHRGNYTGFIDAIKTASTTQISKFVPRFMSEAAVRERVTNLMETDWRSLAAVVLEERLAANNGSYTFEL